MVMKKSILTFSLLLMGIASVFAQYNRVNDIAYSQDGNAYAKERCKLDVYYPTDKKDVPVVVWFHGGGIEAGEKYIDNELLDAGYTVIAANYRLLPKATIDEVLDDAAAVVAWAFKNAEKYNGSKRKIFVAGHSAGGYMLDLREIPDMDLSKPWWEQEANRWYEMNGRLFFTHSPMQLHYYESLIAIFFSKKISPPGMTRNNLQIPVFRQNGVELRKTACLVGKIPAAANYNSCFHRFTPLSSGYTH